MNKIVINKQSTPSLHDQNHSIGLNMFYQQEIQNKNNQKLSKSSEILNSDAEADSF